MANPDLINRYEIGENGATSRANHRAKIKMDDVLKTLAKFLHKMAKARLGGGVNRRASILSMLISHEIAGQVIAYKDEEGELAWKASDDLRRELE